uniref:Uncharacterized protein n=1 Tax=Arundo donax TaxID=35708 RepID=A0A0A9AMW4_ARUDO
MHFELEGVCELGLWYDSNGRMGQHRSSINSMIMCVWVSAKKHVQNTIRMPRGIIIYKDMPDLSKQLDWERSFCVVA